MPVHKEHGSASAIDSFVECPVRYIRHYDENTSVTTRSEASDVGVLLHAALEMFRDPRWPHTYSYEVFVNCFEMVCKDQLYAESLKAYKKAKDMLPTAYRLTEQHPTIPMHLAVPLAVEQPLVQRAADGSWELWRQPSWPLPIKGAIDFLALIETTEGYTLFINDDKTGQPKTHYELVNDKIQMAEYFLYARRIVVPILEAQGYRITRIVGAVTYIADGSAVPLYEDDFDHDVTEAYIANILTQMVNFENLYNKKLAELEPLKDYVQELPTFGDYEEKLNEWFSHHEKPNKYCSYCPRSNVCQTFNRLLEYKAVVNLSGDIDWVAFYEEYKKLQNIESAATKRLEKMKETIKIWREQEGVSAIPIGTTGLQFTANSQTRERYLNERIVEVYGVEWFIRNASLTKKVVEQRADEIAATDPERFINEIKPAIPSLSVSTPYSQPVTITKVPEEKNKK